MRDVNLVVGMLLEATDRLADARTFVKLADFLATCLQVSYTHMAYHVMERAKGKRTTKTYRFKPGNVEKLLSLDPNTLGGIVFDSLKENRDFMDPNLSLGTSFSLAPDCPAEMKVIVDATHLVGRPSIVDLTALIHELEKLGYPLVSGVAFFMKREKYPVFYVRGIVVQKLTKEERAVADALNPGIRRYRTKIWDIFRHNVVRKEFLDAEMLGEIRNVVGEANIHEVGQFYTISLPIQDAEYLGELEKTGYYKDRLRALFQSRDMIMYKLGTETEELPNGLL